MMFQRTLLIFLSIAFVVFAGEKYTSGNTKVKVTTRYVDDNNSTESCVSYISNAPEKYTTACFTAYYTDGGTFQGCKLQFDNESCDVCDACTDVNEAIGYKLDCDSFLPSKSNILDQGACTVLNDTNIQMTLTDETTFVNIPFDLTVSTRPVTDDSDMNNNTTNGNTSGSSKRVVIFIWYSTFAFAVFYTMVAAF